jgi:GT2 family glycosyltransferase
MSPDQPDRPRVDVGVVTFNTRDLTVAALRRLVEGDPGCDLRLLVRDNASSDGTAAAIAREVPTAEVEVGKVNVGFAGGVNTLLARSEAPWFFLLNSDAWPEPGAIRELVETARRLPRAAAVAPRLLRPDGTLEHSTHPFPSIRVAAVTGLGATRLIGFERSRRLLLHGAWRHDAARPVDWAVGAALLLRRAAVEQVGGFDERFFMYVEDLEWCWRAHQRGWEIYFEPAAVATHVGNVAGSIAYGARRTATYMANTYAFYRREHGVIAAALYRGLNVVGSAMHYAGARRAHDEDAAHFWRIQVKAHVARARDVDPRPTT